MWFFAVLVVLVMGGVAALAAGRGTPMAPAYDDRPDALVPKDRLLGAEDLRRVRFSLAFRGYRMSEVDALLDRLARELEERSERCERSESGHHGPDGRQGEVSDTPSVREGRGDDPVA